MVAGYAVMRRNACKEHGETELSVVLSLGSCLRWNRSCTMAGTFLQQVAIGHLSNAVWTPYHFWCCCKVLSERRRLESGSMKDRHLEYWVPVG